MPASTNDAIWRRSSFGASQIRIDVLVEIDGEALADRSMRTQVQGSAKPVPLESLA
ncbi:hypothetical protein XHC_2507 [Xanthomonas hortorum pv. carotae str. M081]|nr:hypothetical protein XHC_2507 [Xanthomonas hortorum pv. carotae str. M081]